MEKEIFNSNTNNSLLNKNTSNDVLIKIKFKKYNNYTEFIELISDICNDTEDEDCIQYFKDETEVLIDIFDEVNELKDGIYIIEYNLISGYSITDIGYEYDVDYTLISINVV